jgi:hypothetical protein
MAYEMKARGAEAEMKVSSHPVNSLLALFPGLVVVPPLVSDRRGPKRAQGAAKVAAREPINGWTALVLHLVVSIGLCVHLQVSLNRIWEQEAEPLPGHYEAPPGVEPLSPRVA